DKARAVLRLDATKACDEVPSNALEWAPVAPRRTVGHHVLRCRIDAIPYRTAGRFPPGDRPDVVGATAKQQIKALAMRGHDQLPAGGGPIGRGPVVVGEVAPIGGVLDHAVQRDVFDDFELSHSLSISAGIGKRSWNHACHTGVSRATRSPA